MILGGGTGSISSFSQKDQTNLYKFISPKQWKQEYFSTSKKINDLALDLHNADPNEKKELQKELDSLIEKRNKQLSDLTQSFENLSETELKQYAENLDKIYKNTNKIGNKKFSSTTQENAESENLELIQENFDLVGKEYTAKDIEIEKIIGETLRASEIIEKRLGKLKGIIEMI